MERCETERCKKRLIKGENGQKQDSKRKERCQRVISQGVSCQEQWVVLHLFSHPCQLNGG